MQFPCLEFLKKKLEKIQTQKKKTATEKKLIEKQLQILNLFQKIADPSLPVPLDAPTSSTISLSGSEWATAAKYFELHNPYFIDHYTEDNFKIYKKDNTLTYTYTVSIDSREGKYEISFFFDSDMHLDLSKTTPPGISLSGAGLYQGNKKICNFTEAYAFLKIKVTKGYENFLQNMLGTIETINESNQFVPDETKINAFAPDNTDLRLLQELDTLAKNNPKIDSLQKFRQEKTQ